MGRAGGTTRKNSLACGWAHDKTVADSTKVDAKSLEAISPLHTTLFVTPPTLRSHPWMIIEVEKTSKRAAGVLLRSGLVAARAPTLAGKGDIVRESNGAPHHLVHARSASQNCDIFLTNN